jgi:hypothetical protein
VSGPAKEYPYYLGVRLSEELGDKIDILCKRKKLSRSKWLRDELEKSVNGSKPKRTSEHRKQRKLDIEAVELEYNNGRNAYFREFKGREAPGSVSFTSKRRKAAGIALDTYSLPVVKAAMRGIFLDEWFTENGMISPDYALRLKNIERFSNLVFDLRAEQDKRRKK